MAPKKHKDEDTTETEATASVEAPAPRKAKPLKKISIQTVAGKIKEWFRTNIAEVTKRCAESAAGTVHICRIWGKVVKTTPGDSAYGPFVRFQGAFFGMSGLDGELYSAGQCLLPKWLEMEVDAAFSEHGDTVYFGYDIFLKLAPDASLGYEYVAERLTEPKTDMSVIEEKFPELPPLYTALQLTDQSEKTA